MKLNDARNTAPHILRRLARDRPDLLEKYERGEEVEPPPPRNTSKLRGGHHGYNITMKRGGTGYPRIGFKPRTEPSVGWHQRARSGRLAPTGVHLASNLARMSVLIG